MNILYINHYAGSPSYGMEFRPFYMSREWQKRGCKVTILAGSYSHVRAKQPVMKKGIKKYTEYIENIEYFWYKTPLYEGNGIGRLINIFSFLFQVWLDNKNLVKKVRPDVVIASSTYPMDIWVAKYIAKKAKAKLVFEVHDLWPLSPVELGGMSNSHPFVKLCEWAENTAYRDADLVVSMLPDIGHYIASRKFNITRLVIVPNGIVEEDWRIEDNITLNGEIKSFFDEKYNQGFKIIGYTGAHGKPNALETLLKVAKHLQQEKICFVLFGNGLEKESLVNIAQHENIENVYFFDPVPKKQIPLLLKEFDIGYIGLQNQPLFRFGISPNKLMDYMMAGIPIVCAIKSSNDIVMEQGCGVTTNPEEIEDISNGILYLLGLSDKERQRMGERGRAFILNERTYNKLAEKFLNTMKDVVMRNE